MSDREKQLEAVAARAKRALDRFYRWLSEAMGVQDTAADVRRLTTPDADGADQDDADQDDADGWGDEDDRRSESIRQRLAALEQRVADLKAVARPKPKT
jgi:hypothetical protein